LSPVHNKKMFKNMFFISGSGRYCSSLGGWRKLFILAPKPACCLYIYCTYTCMYIRSQSIFCDKLVQCLELGICRFGSKLHVRTSEDKNIHIIIYTFSLLKRTKEKQFGFLSLRLNLRWSQLNSRDMGLKREFLV